VSFTKILIEQFQMTHDSQTVSDDRRALSAAHMPVDILQFHLRVLFNCSAFYWQTNCMTLSWLADPAGLSLDVLKIEFPFEVASFFEGLFSVRFLSVSPPFSLFHSLPLLSHRL